LQFEQFYKTLRYVFEYEQQLYEGLSAAQKQSLTEDVIKEISDIESATSSLLRGSTDVEIIEEPIS